MDLLDSLAVRLGIAAVLLLKVLDDVLATVGVIVRQLMAMGLVES